jgi:3',5'-cyclic AMP phosphodiesterase CpdA
MTQELLSADPAHKVIIQLSDIHITDGGLLNDSVDSLANLAAILSAVEESGDHPDLLLFTGDLADKGEPEAYRRFRATVEPFAARMGVPACYMPGNHDERRAFRKHLLDWEENDEVIDQVVWCDGLRVIALDSTVLGGHHGEIDDAQLAWLESELETAAPLGTILALHHPPVPGPSAFLNEIILREPERLAKVLSGSDVSMILAGHTHHASAGSLAGIPVWVATATAYQMDVVAVATRSLRGIPGSAYTRIDVAPDGPVATHIPMIDAERPVYEIDFETIGRWIKSGASAEEIEAAFTRPGDENGE